MGLFEFVFDLISEILVQIISRKALLIILLIAVIAASYMVLVK